jgi:hypothetical protein
MNDVRTSNVLEQGYIFFLSALEIRSRLYKPVVLPVVLCGCETWSLTLGEERGLGVIENRVLRRIFGPQLNEMRGGWRELHNEELRDLYSSPSITGQVIEVSAFKGIQENRRQTSPSPDLRAETDSVSETSYFVGFRIPDDAQIPERQYF